MLYIPFGGADLCIFIGRGSLIRAAVLAPRCYALNTICMPRWGAPQKKDLSSVFSIATWSPINKKSARRRSSATLLLTSNVLSCRHADLYGLWSFCALFSLSLVPYLRIGLCSNLVMHENTRLNLDFVLFYLLTKSVEVVTSSVNVWDNHRRSRFQSRSFITSGYLLERHITYQLS